MTKVETLTFEYEHCGECASALVAEQVNRCDRGEHLRKIPDLWGDIPDWCPLEEKKNAKV